MKENLKKIWQNLPNAVKKDLGKFLKYEFLDIKGKKENDIEYKRRYLKLIFELNTIIVTYTGDLEGFQGYNKGFKSYVYCLKKPFWNIEFKDFEKQRKIQPKKTKKEGIF